MTDYFLASTDSARKGTAALRALGQDVQWEYGLLWKRVSALAGAWVKQGLQVGDRVLFSPQLDCESVVVLHALMWRGAVPVLVSPRQFEALDEEHDGSLELRWRIGGEGSIAELSPQASEGAPPVLRDADDEALVLFSSGSTGSPKAIPLTRCQLLASIEKSASRLEMSHLDRWLCVLPLYHVGGLSILFRCAQMGGEVVLMSEGFSAEKAWEACATGTVTQVSLVPVQLQRMLPFITGALPASFRFFLVGGAPMSKEQMHDAQRLELPVLRTWGMTECASQIATTRLGDVDGPLWPLEGTRVERTESGRLAVHGAIAPGGYFLTQDIGEVDGGIRIQSRADQVILSGGEKISLTRLQNALGEHPQIVDCIVISCEDAVWGERPHAIVVARKSVTPTTDDLFSYLADGGFRRREMFGTLTWLQAIPRNEMGKLQWSELQSLL